MKLNYHPETDSLYIDLSERSSAESREISEGVVLDYDVDGRLVGIDIDNASKKVELKKLILSRLPVKVETVAAWFVSELKPDEGEDLIVGGKWPIVTLIGQPEYRANSMKTLSLSEAKMKLGALVDLVRNTDQEVVITKNGRPSSVAPASWTRAMLGWFMMVRAWCSTSKRASTSFVSIPSLMIFSATLLFTGFLCSAAHTSPKPPSPSFSRSL